MADLIRITRQQAEEMAGKFDADHETWPGQSVLVATNADPECGYQLPLDHPEAEFFSTGEPDNFIVIRVPYGSSPRARHGTEFCFEYLGWGDETVYAANTEAFEAHAKEMKADHLLPQMRAFLDTLEPDIRATVEPSMHLGVGSVGVRVHDASIETAMRDRGDDNPLRLAIHANPFLTYHDSEVTKGAVIGPPWLLQRTKEEHPDWDIEAIARHVLTTAAREGNHRDTPLPADGNG